MYLALARKYRPQTFEEVIGQDAVLNTLKNAIKKDRVHHAYLFCGARGVGKTSMARMLAKCLNCETGPTAAPCQKCTSCVGITKGSSLDVIEIDAASNTGVDNIRELREQVKYMPQEGHYKIYIIDEVHMLSNSAFNALLKTLEEPPAHVKFILATTEPHDIPITILSRCQRYDFRKLPVDLLSTHLQKILEQENVKAEKEAVRLIAECARGSVRDALSLLDQAIAFDNEELKEADVRSLLGLGERQLIQDIFKALVSQGLEEALKGLNELDTLGIDLKFFTEELIQAYRNLILLTSTGKLPSDVSPSEKEFYQSLQDKLEISILLAQYQILFQGSKEIAYADFQKVALEMTFVKIVHASEMVGLVSLVAELKNRSSKGGGGVRPKTASGPAPRPQASDGQKKKPEITRNPQEIQRVTISYPKDWYDMVKWFSKVKASLAGWLGDAVPISFSSDKIEVSYAADSPAKKVMIERRTMIEELLQKHFGRRIEFLISDNASEKKGLSFKEKVNIQRKKLQDSAENEIHSHPVVKDWMDNYGVKIKNIKVANRH